MGNEHENDETLQALKDAAAKRAKKEEEEEELEVRELALVDGEVRDLTRVTGASLQAVKKVAAKDAEEAAARTWGGAASFPEGSDPLWCEGKSPHTRRDPAAP